MRKIHILALMAGSLALNPQRAQAQPPAGWHAGVAQGNTLTMKLATYDADAPLNISLVDVNRAAVVYKKVNAPGVSISTGSVAGGICMLTITNGKKYYTRKIVIQ